MFNIKGFFWKEKEKVGLTYRGQTYGQWDTLDTNVNLYYKLYRQNTDLRRCIEELCQTVGKEWIIIKKWEKILNNTLYTNILDYNYWDFHTLKALIIRDLIISWNVFILNIKNLQWKIIWFQILDPRTIFIVADKYWEILWYMQKVRGDIITFLPNEIFHFKDMVDHDNEIMWISKIETLIYSIITDIESEKSNYAFFKNNAIPNTIITLDNELDENELKIALSQLQKQFAWWENRHRVSASTWIKDVKVIWSSMEDMQYTLLRAFTTERICAAMWVPKTILWYSDNVNYSTSDNQYRKYIENTIKPLEKQISKIIEILLKQLDPLINFNFTQNNSLDFAERVERYEKLINIWVMTINEVRTDLWFDEYTEENASKPIIKNWYTLVEDIGADLMKNWQEVINDNTN